jgi:hypothetical protein
MVDPEIYPQVLKLDLKSPSGNYYTVIERFASSDDYIKYCDSQLWSGYKVIGSRPYMKLKNQEEDVTN